LFGEGRERFFSGADDEAAESGLFQEKLEGILQSFVIIDDEDGGLTGLFVAEDIAIESIFFDAPPTADLDGRELATLHEVINRGQRNTQIFRGFFDGHEVVHVGSAALRKTINTKRRPLKSGNFVFSRAGGMDDGPE
jgi:hypothetical protein